jgi:alpha-mannosidase
LGGFDPVRVTSRSKEALGVETDLLRLTFDLKSGGISGMAPANGVGTAPAVSAAGRPLGRLAVHLTGRYQINYGHELRAWEDGLTGARDFLPPVAHEVRRHSGGRMGVLFVYRYGHSRFTQEYLLEPGTPFVETTLGGDWREVEKYLKVHFSFDSSEARTAFADLPYGYTDSLPLGQEYPMMYFCGIRDSRCVLAVLNNSRHGCLFDGEDLSLSAIRCATYPARLSDEGEFQLSYRILGLPGRNIDWRSQVYGQAFAFNVAPVGYSAEYTAARLPSDWHAPSVNRLTENVLGTCLKPTESGEGWIIRLFNADIRGCRAPIQSGRIVDILDEETAASKASSTGEIEFRPLELKSLRFEGF